MISLKVFFRQLIIVVLITLSVTAVANDEAIFCDDNYCETDKDCESHRLASSPCQELSHYKCVVETEMIMGFYECKAKKCRHPHKKSAYCEAGVLLQSVPNACQSKSGYASAIPKDSLIITIKTPALKDLATQIPFSWLTANIHGIKTEVQKLLNCYGLSHITVMFKDYSEVSNWEKNIYGLGYDLWYLRNSAIATIDDYMAGVGIATSDIYSGNHFNLNIPLASPLQKNRLSNVGIQISWPHSAVILNRYQIQNNPLKSQQSLAATIAHEYIHTLSHQVVSSLMVKEETAERSCKGLKATNSYLADASQSTLERWGMSDDWHTPLPSIMRPGTAIKDVTVTQCIKESNLDFSRVCGQEDKCTASYTKKNFFGLPANLRTDIITFSKRRSATIAKNGCFKPCLPAP